jgi:hypothetical protein
MRRKDWDMHFAESGAKAIELMQESRVGGGSSDAQVPQRSSGERSCDAPPSSSCTTSIFRDLYLASESLNLQCVSL